MPTEGDRSSRPGKPPKVAMLGLGAMGERMAARLIAAGLDVAAWNRSQTHGAGRSAIARARRQSIGEAVDGADLVIAMVLDDEASRAVWTGEEGALDAMRPGAIAVDCSTLSLAWIRTLARASEAAGHAFLDAPVGGSLAQAEAGDLIFLVGGDTSTLECAAPILRVLGREIFHVGGNGAGMAMKLLANGLYAAQAAALAELIALPAEAGVAPEMLIESLGALSVSSPAAVNLARAMATSATVNIPLRLLAKDIGFARASIEPSPAPVLDALGQSFGEALARDPGMLLADLRPRT